MSDNEIAFIVITISLAIVFGYFGYRYLEGGKKRNKRGKS